MPRKAAVRRCSHCGRPAKLHVVNGRNKGWAKTCGRQACIRKRKRPGAHNLQLFGTTGTCELCRKTYRRRGWKQRWCKRCVPSAAWRHRARRYGVGKVQWGDLLKKQGGVCALCDGKPAVVDHDHKHGGVRGLLCSACNTALAAFDRTAGWRKKAQRYRSRAGKQ